MLLVIKSRSFWEGGVSFVISPSRLLLKQRKATKVEKVLWWCVHMCMFVGQRWDCENSELWISQKSGCKNQSENSVAWNKLLFLYLPMVMKLHIWLADFKSWWWCDRLECPYRFQNWEKGFKMAGSLFCIPPDTDISTDTTIFPRGIFFLLCHRLLET